MKKAKGMVVSNWIAAALLLVANLGLFGAARGGALAPVVNPPLWGALAALNGAAILWAANMLGLQPLLAAVSYVAGGAVACLAAADVCGVEMASASAVYGAVGALVIGRLASRARLSFHREGQAPFMALLLGLVVVAAALDGQVVPAEQGIVFDAVALPLLVAGVGGGLGWALLSRRAVGANKPSPAIDAPAPTEEEAAPEPAAAEQLVIPMPEAARPDEEPFTPPPELPLPPSAPDAEAEALDAAPAPEIDAPAAAGPSGPEPNLLAVMAELDTQTLPDASPAAVPEAAAEPRRAADDLLNEHHDLLSRLK